MPVSHGHTGKPIVMHSASFGIVSVYWAFSGRSLSFRCDATEVNALPPGSVPRVNHSGGRVMTITTKRSDIQATAPFAVPRPVPNRLATHVLPALIVLLAFAAGAVHLIHNLLPMVAPLLMDASGPGGAP